MRTDDSRGNRNHESTFRKAARKTGKDYTKFRRTLEFEPRSDPEDRDNYTSELILGGEDGIMKMHKFEMAACA